MVQKDYSNYLLRGNSNEMKILNVYRSRVRNDIAIFSKLDTFRVLLYKVNSIKENNLSNFLKVEECNTKESSKISYRVINNDIPYKFTYASGNEPQATQILLKAEGDYVEKTFASDTLVVLNLCASRLSLNFSKETSVNDIFIEAKPKGLELKKMYLSLMFTRKKNQIFLTIFSNTKGDKKIPKNLYEEFY